MVPLVTDVGAHGVVVSLAQLFFVLVPAVPVVYPRVVARASVIKMLVALAGPPVHCEPLPVKKVVPIKWLLNMLRK